MFVADKLVYLQMEKTASTHIARVLAEVVGGAQHTQHVHLTRDPIGARLDVDTAGRLVFASIRNPWSWYLSLWAYGCRGSGGRYGTYHRLTAPPPSLREIAVASARRARATRQLPFDELRRLRTERAQQRRVRADLWRPLYADADDVGAFRAWLRLLYDESSAHEVFPEFARTPMRWHSGFLTFRYFWNFSRDRGLLLRPGAVEAVADLAPFERRGMLVDDMVVVERLHADLDRVLAAAGYQLDDAQRSRLEELCATRTNESPHRNDRDYFDDDLVDLVAERERYLVDRFGLEAPR